MRKREGKERRSGKREWWKEGKDEKRGKIGEKKRCGGG